MTVLWFALVTASPEHDAGCPWYVKNTRPAVCATLPPETQAAPVGGFVAGVSDGRPAGTGRQFVGMAARSSSGSALRMRSGVHHRSSRSRAIWDAAIGWTA